MKLETVGSNQTLVKFSDGREVFFSYETPVAAHIPGVGFFRTEQTYSRTTTGHINHYFANNGAAGKVVTQEYLEKILAGNAD